MKNQILILIALATAYCCLGETPVGDPCNPPPREGEVTLKPVSFNTDELMDIIKKGADLVNEIPNRPISIEPGKGINIEIEIKQTEVCCQGEVKKLVKYKGGGGFDAGTLEGSGPIPGLFYPGVGGFMMEVGGSFSGEFAISTTYGTCDSKPDKCGDVTVKLGAQGGITGTIIHPTIASIEGAVKVECTASGSYCLDEGLKEPAFCVEVKVDCTVNLMWNSVVLWEKIELIKECI